MRFYRGCEAKDREEVSSNAPPSYMPISCTCNIGLPIYSRTRCHAMGVIEEGASRSSTSRSDKCQTSMLMCWMSMELYAVDTDVRSETGLFVRVSSIPNLPAGAKRGP